MHIAEIINALRKLGHEMIIVEPESINNKEFGQSSYFVKKIRVLLSGFVSALVEFFYSIGDHFKLMKAVRQHSPYFIYEDYNSCLAEGGKKVRAANAEKKVVRLGTKLLSQKDVSTNLLVSNPR